MRVVDAFEIKDSYPTEHAAGLVVVLDQLIAKDSSQLVGRVARIRLPDGGCRSLPVHEAREHGSVNSLFFRDLRLGEIPLNSEIDLEHVAQDDPIRPTAVSAS